MKNNKKKHNNKQQTKQINQTIKQYQYYENNKIATLIFLSCLFLGLGLGIAFKMDSVGLFIGIGIGFLINALLKIKNKSQINDIRKISYYFIISNYEDFFIGILFGVLFIFFGILLIHFKLYFHISLGFLIVLLLLKFIIGLFLIFIGILTIISSISFFLKLKYNNIKKSNIKKISQLH
ncbi:hypothetical protein M1278_00275 [Candidatus Marsarchaeota archaeon]|nr:hypothetical protein [Candidatus Marsarchaeota archaeon]